MPSVFPSVCPLVLAGLVAGLFAYWCAHQLLVYRFGLFPQAPLRTPRWAAALTCAIVFPMLGLRYGIDAEAIQLMALSTALAIASLTDLTARVIPRECVVVAFSIRAIYLAYIWRSSGLQMVLGLASTSLIGCLGLVVPLLALVLALDRILGTESMGGGDIKLFAVSGAYFGWLRGTFLVFLACALGIASCTCLPCTGQEAREMRGGARHTFPFGPAISAACVLTALVGDGVVRWCLQLPSP